MTPTQQQIEDWANNPIASNRKTGMVERYVTKDGNIIEQTESGMWCLLIRVERERYQLKEVANTRQELEGIDPHKDYNAY